MSSYRSTSSTTRISALTNLFSLARQGFLRSNGYKPTMHTQFHLEGLFERMSTNHAYNSQIWGTLAVSTQPHYNAYTFPSKPKRSQYRKPKPRYTYIYLSTNVWSRTCLSMASPRIVCLSCQPPRFGFPMFSSSSSTRNPYQRAEKGNGTMSF